MIEFSIIDSPDQKFSALVDGRRVSLRVRFNSSNDRWSFDLSIDGEAVLHGRKIIAGVDLLAAFDFGIGVIFALPEGEALPDRAALPSKQVRVYHATMEAVHAAMAS